jgi:segregation and condensation protein A
MSEPGRDYTVQLDAVFQGPMDLLLHLVREQEVDIHDIQINPIVDGYLCYLRELEQIDIELASEFVLMAATLMAIKSRSLLPREEIDLQSAIDPRDELIQRLIEYRRFRESAQDLSARFQARSSLHTRGRFTEPGEEPDLDLSDLTKWNLLSEYSRLLRETRGRGPMHIEADERPLRYYVEQMVDWLRNERETSLRALVKRSAADGNRRQLIGSFCALLELVKLGVARAWQPTRAADITIVLRDDVGGDVNEILAHADLDDEELGTPGPPPEGRASDEDPGEALRN